jgi:hypothetical protein
MIALEFAELVPTWRSNASVQLPADAAGLDLGYEVAFPFLAATDEESPVGSDIAS